MIHIIWSGKGFVVAVIALGFSLIANLLTNSLTGSAAYWDAHKWPLAVSLLASGAACLPVGLYFHNLKAQVLVDAKTGKEVILRQSHTLFFSNYSGPLGLGRGASSCTVSQSSGGFRRLEIF